MSFVDYLDEVLFDTTGNIKIDLRQYLVGKIIGLGAVILNGYSYENLEGNISYLCNCKEFDGAFDGVCRYIYIENYREPDYGYTEGGVIPTPERMICDFFMYPDELNFNLYVWDALIGYQDDDETPDDFSLVFEMFDHFGLDKSKLESAISELDYMRED